MLQKYNVNNSIMETRQITQVKIYKLVLNPMRDKTEKSTLAAIAYDKSRLLQWYEEQRATEAFVEAGTGSFECHGYTHNWRKTFKKDSPLEWFNPMDSEQPNYFGHGIQEEWTTEEAVRYLGGIIIY